MTDYTTSILWGVVLGLLHGIILWGSMYSYALASFMLFNQDPYYLPLLITGIIDVVSLITVLSSGWWIDKAETFLTAGFESYDRYHEEREAIEQETKEE